MNGRPLRILSLGAGVQSTTVLLKSLAGELPPIDHAIFADTGWEPAAVYQHLDRLAAIMAEDDVPLHRVSAGNLRDDATSPGRSASIPFFVKNPDGGAGIARRQCTNEYKLRPIHSKVRELVGLKSGQRHAGHLVDMVLGISLDEAHRMSDPKYPWMRHTYPLIDERITRHDCNLWLADNWFDPVPRSACIGCPFHSDAEWRNLRDNHPDEFADAVAFERQAQAANERFVGELYLHRTRHPLDLVDLSTPEDHGQGNLFGEDCQGMCGV